MSLIDFPVPETYDFPEWVRIGDYYYYAKDIIHFGGELTPENLKIAYQKGIFPWTIEGLPLPWFCPEKRAILYFNELHIPKSLSKIAKKNPFTFTIDGKFAEVISICAKIKRNHEAGTWITKDFVSAYCGLHAEGLAHSVEAWEDGELVGGLYGVDVGGVFCGESMFHYRPNASKLALIHLIQHLQTRGSSWIDIQVMTPHLEKLGAIEISRNEFLLKLLEAQSKNLRLF